MSATPNPPARDRRGRAYTPAIGPKLKALLLLVFAGVALLGANSVYLGSVTALNWWTSQGHETFFYYVMFALHLALGLALLVPFLIFAFTHLATAWKRPNRAATRYGLALLAASLVLIVTGVLLWRKFADLDEAPRRVAYWLHVLAPIAAIGLYVQHRFAGPRIKWGWVRAWAGAVVAFVAVMGVLHSQDPREYGKVGPKDAAAYFYPSEAITADGKYIPAKVLMADQYCLQCHQDAYEGWFHSAHHFSSFNNKAYLQSVRETRQVSLKRDGNTNAARWCAGCHDPAPFFSGEFDDPNYDDVSTESSQAGITCTACHAIAHVNSTQGNADYTIGEPLHYPWAFSDNPLLQWANAELIKAKPELHKREFLKPLHKDANFCSTCHKVRLPFALNHYKDFLRGQNHHDTYLLSGVSGHGARSFYYPPKAMNKCADCHMNLVASGDFGARDFDGQGGREIHNHLFLGANTGLAALRGRPDIAAIHEKYLTDKKVRVDIFGLRDGGAIDKPLVAPLRPSVPALKPKNKYLVEVVVRTLGLGHPFSQGTVDSNEIWVELVAKSGDKVLGRSGGIGEDGQVDPFAHFINVYMLDKDGNRIDRRNPQDIFVPLYNKQIPPGAGQAIHFALEVPEGHSAPIELEAKVNYRKFDQTYMNYLFGKGKAPELPVVVMAKDAVKLAVEGGPAVENPPSPIADEWQRWNDYGIGLFLEGSEMGGQKGELRQAEEAFKKVADLGRVDGWVNLARVYLREGRIPDALAALEKATAHPEAPAPWVIAWLTGQTNEQNGYLDEAIASYQSVLETHDDARGFDFSQDYEIINALGRVYYGRARQESPDSSARREFLELCIATYRRTLAIDSENVAAHYGLGLAYSDWARGQEGAAKAPAPAEVDAEALEALAARVGDAGQPPEARGEAAASLAVSVAAYSAGPRPQYQSRMAPLHALGGRGRARLRAGRLGRGAPLPGRRRPRARRRAQGAPHPLQAGRDGRGAGHVAGPGQQPRRRPQRAIDRDPPPAPPRGGRGHAQRPGRLPRGADRRRGPRAPPPHAATVQETRR